MNSIRRTRFFSSDFPLHIMLIPGVIITLIYSYGPMAGIIMAFQKFNPALGFFKSKWVGMKNFEYIINLPDFYQILINTLAISFWKIILGLLVPVIIAIMLNEIGQSWLKRSIQTSIYLPYFLSWVIFGGIIVEVFSLKGPFNILLSNFGVDPIFFLGSNDWFRKLVISTDVWKNFGFNTIVFLAAIANINPSLYEASEVDGANRWKQTLHITLPGMSTIIILVSVLSIGNILNAGFEQILALYSPIVYESGDIIDTFVYRMGVFQNQFSPAAAVGVFKSVVSFILVSTSYYLAYKLANYRIF